MNYSLIEPDGSPISITAIGAEQSIHATEVRQTAISGWHLHYIIKGRGNFCGTELGAGDGFVICPSQYVHYYPSEADPWEYVWIRVYGDGARELFSSIGIDESNNTFKYSFTDTARHVFELISATRVDDVELQRFARGIFDLMISYHVGTSERASQLSAPQRYVAAAKDYITEACSSPLRVTDIAAYLHIDDQYLYNIFMRYEGVSPKRYITSCRIKRACDLLRSEKHSLTEIAELTGYRDLARFSAAFKRETGQSPGTYRAVKRSGNVDEIL